MSTTRKLITLKSSDGESFEVDEAVAMQSLTIKHMHIEGHVDIDGAIPLPHVTSKILAKVIDYCQKELYSSSSTAEADADAGGGDEDVKRAWEMSDLAGVGEDTLWDLLLAANYLEVEGLLDLAYEAVEEMVKGRIDPEIRMVLNLREDHRCCQKPWACI
ncbi:unnamed protein product [Linum tenue]|uniref:SKP1-like protein n=2 Tax=Linum tenue TaxID=586396 RepID=A0AAV0QZ00_9ROSI|nr:unnamed protein product [Linum tenue]